MSKINVYEELQKRILSGDYNIKMRLPTEEMLIKEFDTSRYSVRKAIEQLVDDGLVYSVKGKGVVVLENTLQSQKLNLNLGKIDNLQALNTNQILNRKTTIASFKLIIVNEKISKKTLFPIGTPIYLIKRIRNVNNENLALDINYFNAQLIPDLTKEIAAGSIYQYIKDNLQMKIAVVKRQLRIEPASESDYKYLSLKDSNCVGNMISLAFNDDGKQFEYTESHFIPDNFVFTQIIQF